MRYTVHLLTVVWHNGLFDRWHSCLPGSILSATVLRSLKNNSGRDVMLDALSAIDQTQLDELNLIVEYCWKERGKNQYVYSGFYSNRNNERLDYGVGCMVNYERNINWMHYMVANITGVPDSSDS